MTDQRIYLDHNATAPLRVQAREAMLVAMGAYGAASSIHAEGRAARQLVERAREQVAGLVDAEPQHVVFTSGATEANTTALSPAWQISSKASVVERCMVSAVEHLSVLKGARFSPEQMESMPVDRDGLANPPVWKNRLELFAATGARPLVSLMLANNETGVIQPIREIAQLVQEVGGVMHCDAAQAAGKIPVSLRELGVDLLTLSSHKLGGPFGGGALIKASDALHLVDPLIRGGGQERGARAGTENLVAIAGFGAAAEVAKRELVIELVRQSALRDRLEMGLRAIASDLVIFGEAVERLPNTVCFAVPQISAEIALIRLDLDGFAVSSGSACSSGTVKASHVLAAMKVPPDLAACAVRVSLGRTTTETDIESFLTAFHRLHESIHTRRGSKAA